MNEIRPTSTPAEDRALVHLQAVLFKSELPADHPAHARLDAVIERTRPLVLAEEIPGTLEQTDTDPLAFAFFSVGAVCLLAAGALRGFSLVASLILVLAGCTFIHLAYDKAGY
jgi:hypothetical protein